MLCTMFSIAQIWNTFDIYKQVSSVWDVTIAGPPRCLVWCRLYGTVYRRKRPENTQNGGTVLLIGNLRADSESGSPDYYSSFFLVTICLSRLVSEIFVCNRQTDKWTDRRTDNADHYYSWSHIVRGQLIIALRRRTLTWPNEFQQTSGNSVPYNMNIYI